MQWNGLWVAGVGSSIGETLSADEAVASGDYPASEAAKGGGKSGSVMTRTDWADAAVTAARRALSASGYGAGSVRMLVHSVVLGADAPDMWSPAHYVQRELGIGHDCHSAELRQGCNGLG